MTPHGGIASVALDNGAATTISFYSPVEQGNKPLWTSPTLGDGLHTFTLEVTGTKIQASLGAEVIVDRLEIFSTGLVGGTTQASNATSNVPCVTPTTLPSKPTFQPPTNTPSGNTVAPTRSPLQTTLNPCGATPPANSLVRRADGLLVDPHAVLPPIGVPNQSHQPTSNTHPKAAASASTASAATASKIAFGSDRDEFYSEIYTMNSDGTGVQRLTATGQSFFNDEAAWSPDGQQIAYASNLVANSTTNIYVMNADGANQHSITNNPSGTGSYSPHWSPDGTKIVFAQNSGSLNWTYFIINVDGSNPISIYSAEVSNFSLAWPVWSPDGQRIAFSASRPTHDGDSIYTMNIDGTQVQQVTTDSTIDGYPSWSPDGTQISYVAFSGPENESHGYIYVMNADGSNPRRLTNTNNDFGPAPWSPDGSQIAFSSIRDGTGQIYVMNADGSGQTNISNNPFKTDFYAAWGPAVTSSGQLACQALDPKLAYYQGFPVLNQQTFPGFSYGSVITYTNDLTDLGVFVVPCYFTDASGNRIIRFATNVPPGNTDTASKEARSLLILNYANYFASGPLDGIHDWCFQGDNRYDNSGVQRSVPTSDDGTKYNVPPIGVNCAPDVTQAVRLAQAQSAGVVSGPCGTLPAAVYRAIGYFNLSASDIASNIWGPLGYETMIKNGDPYLNHTYTQIRVDFALSDNVMPSFVIGGLTPFNGEANWGNWYYEGDPADSVVQWPASLPKLSFAPTGDLTQVKAGDFVATHTFEYQQSDIQLDPSDPKSTLLNYWKGYENRPRQPSEPIFPNLPVGYSRPTTGLRDNPLHMQLVVGWGPNPRANLSSWKSTYDGKLYSSWDEIPPDVRGNLYDYDYIPYVIDRGGRYNLPAGQEDYAMRGPRPFYMQYSTSYILFFAAQP